MEQREKLDVRKTEKDNFRVVRGTVGDLLKGYSLAIPPHLPEFDVQCLSGSSVSSSRRRTTMGHVVPLLDPPF